VLYQTKALDVLIIFPKMADEIRSIPEKLWPDKGRKSSFYALISF